MKFKNIKGGTEKDAYNKFPWLERATFENADIDITNDYLIWEDGFWEGGIWEDGIWKYGVWKYGVWEGGIWECGFWGYGVWEGGAWKDGFWEDGWMWDNINQKYQSVVRKDGKFEIEQ